MKRFKDFDKFTKAVGMVKVNKVPKGLPEIEENFNGYAQFCISKLAKLKAFCDKNPKYHIVTMVDGEGSGLYLDNSIRIVNRVAYFLGTSGFPNWYLDDNS